MSSTVISPNLQSILNAALADYREHTGVDLSQHPFAESVRASQSADAILELLQDKATQFKEYRNGNRKLINCLEAVVRVIHGFSGVLGGVASLVSVAFLFRRPIKCLCPRVQVPFQPTKAIFSGVDVLLGVSISLTFSAVSSSESCLPVQAAIAVGTSYDALVDLFECVANFLGRLHIYTDIPSTPTMSGILITIMVEVLSVLALATKQIKQGRFSMLSMGYVHIPLIAELGAEKFAKKLLGENDIEAVLRRLDRLTDDEARLTIAQTLQVVHGLVNNVKVVMDGMHVLPARRKLLIRLI
jgi:hypothetical protein